MSRAANKLIKAAAGAGAGVDTGDGDFANVVLLLDGDGTNGDNNETFTDSSTNSLTVTETGDVVQGSFSPYGDNWSNYFDNASNTYRLLFADDASFDFGTGDFTVEAWIYRVGTGATVAFLATYAGIIGGNTSGSGSGNDFWSLYVNQDNGKIHWYGDDSTLRTTSNAITDHEWSHVAVSRSSSTLKIFINGVEGYSATVTSTYTIGSNGLSIGRDYDGNAAFNGYISNIRVVKGTGLYTSNFTPSTSPLTAVSGTSLLTCQSNRFIDNSTNNHTATLTGTPKVTPFSPFKNDDARDITTDGGSANFNQNEFLTIADNSALDVSGAMSAEAWIYVNDFPDGTIGSSGQGWVISRWVASGSQRSWAIFLGNDGKTSLYTSSTGGSSYTISTSAAGAIKQYQWHHIAVSWDGLNQRLFIDGDLKVTTSNSSGPYSTPNAPFCVNAINNTLTGTNMDMYVADARYFTDAAIYRAGFTPPTALIGTTGGSNYSIQAAKYESKEFSVSTQDSNPQSWVFNNDGTKGYMVGITNDNIYQYSLSTAYDISTASYDSVSLSLSSQDTTATDMVFGDSGTKLYITGQDQDALFQYNLTAAYDLSTASYANKSLDVSAKDGNPRGLEFNLDGTKVFWGGNTSNKIYEYDLSTAWDISTGTFNQDYSYSSEATNIGGFTFNNDGTRLLLLNLAADKLHQYSLTSAFDISTTAYDDLTFSVNSGTPRSIVFNSDGTKFYICDNNLDKIQQYTTRVVCDVLLNFKDAGIYDRTGINNVDTVADTQIDTAVKKYGTGSIEFDGGNDDELLIKEEAATFTFGTKDFTIEMWAYFDVLSGNRVLIDWHKWHR